MTKGLLGRDEVVLAAMSVAGTRSLTPVQVQKLFFVLDEEEFPDSPYFDFKPYDYGPFDPNVYREIENLGCRGLAEVSLSQHNYRTYRLTEEGHEKGVLALKQMSESTRDYINRLVEWILPLGFGDIVSSIYEAYPKTKENSVFLER